MRIEMLFDGGRLHVLPLKTYTVPALGSHTVENGYDLAGGIASGMVEISSLEDGSVDSGPMVVDPDGGSASLELVNVQPGRVLVSGKLLLNSTGTVEVFGGFVHYHAPAMNAAASPVRSVLDRFKSVFARAKG